MKFGGLFFIFQFELFLPPFAILESLFQKLNNVIKHSRRAVIRIVFWSTKPVTHLEKAKSLLVLYLEQCMASRAKEDKPVRMKPTDTQVLEAEKMRNTTQQKFLKMTDLVNLLWRFDVTKFLKGT